ncbi:hypothetical protein [Sphingomonas jatrophae]|uniref:Uncharacterized protein n=1 Tax=Sphingomonas jatrophae TaxID=1166337 RepID=A0A1I6M9U6_9SPHN|nr:hypothetical protein [Sphingomonas jatrophae]SFS12417.1 hypothetical protein SAMN05192580_3740 [Sphingomonas jatrophae]
MELNPDPFRGPVLYGLEIESGDALVAETWLNRVMLGRTQPGKAAAQSIPIHHDLVVGENLVEVVLGPPGRDLSALPVAFPGAPPSGAHGMVELQGDETRIDGDQLTVTSHPLARDRWDAREAEPPIVLPHRLRIAFKPDHLTASAPWAAGQRADPREAADATYAELRRVAGLLQSGNLDGFAWATARRREHMARCYPLGPDAAQQQQDDVAAIVSMRAKPGFSAELLPSTRAHFRVQADGRLFDWVDGQGEPILTIGTSDRRHALNLQFSLLDGRWTIVR